MIRAVIVAATLATLYCLWNDRNPTSRMVEVPYCPVDVKVGGKDEQGEWHTGWAKMYRPCTELDRYENI
jgi:hypothetical protein